MASINIKVTIGYGLLDLADEIANLSELVPDHMRLEKDEITERISDLISGMIEE